MTIAEQLALAVANANKKRVEALALTLERLASERDELLRTANLSANAKELAEQQASLGRSLEALKHKLAALDEKRDQLEAVFEQKLLATWNGLLSLCDNEINRYEETQIENSFYDAMEAFKDELSHRGLILANATVAQLQQKLPELQMLAENVRERANHLVEVAVEKIAEAPEHYRRHKELEEKHQQVEQEFEVVSARIRLHQHDGDLHLCNQIASADIRAVRRLYREVLVPLLENARIERQKGLAGRDPLEELEAL